MKYSEALSLLVKKKYGQNIIKRTHWGIARVFWDSDLNVVRLIGADSDLYDISMLTEDDHSADDWQFIPSDNLSMLSLKNATALSKVFGVKLKHPRIFGELIYDKELQDIRFFDGRNSKFELMRESAIGWELVDLGFSDAIVIALEMQIPIRRKIWAKDEAIKYSEYKYHYSSPSAKYTFTVDDLSAVPARDIKATDWELIYSVIKSSKEINIEDKIICTTVEAFARAKNYNEKIKRSSWDTDFIRYQRDAQKFLLNDVTEVNIATYGELTQDWVIIQDEQHEDYLSGMNYIEAVEESKKGSFPIKLSSWNDVAIIYSDSATGMVFTSDNSVFNPTLEQITAKDWILDKPSDMFLFARRRMLGITNPKLVRISADISSHEPSSALFKYDWIKASKPEVWSMVDAIGNHTCWIEDNSIENLGTLLLCIFNIETKEIVFGKDLCQTEDGKVIALNKQKYHLQNYLFSR